MPNDDVQLEKIAYVLASEHRKNIILFLDNEYHTPKEIGKAINVKTNHISNLLSQLRKIDLIYCATPNLRKGRLYSLTEEGETVLHYIKTHEEKLKK